MKRINKGSLVWFLVLTAFLLFLLYLLISKKIYTFINPEMIKYTLFGIFGLLILIVFQFIKIFDVHEDSKVKLGYILFILPIVLGITNKGFNVSIAEKKNLTVAERQVSHKNDFMDLNSVHSYKSNKENFIKDGIVNFTEKNYYSILNDISENLDEYVDKKVEIEGFVYKDSDFGNNNFVVARMLMTCCAADSQVVGIMTEYQDAGDIKNGAWVKVSGVIKAKDYKSSNGVVKRGMAVIEIRKIDLISKPVSEYIYP